ncbi:head maturation protease, ClpP-related [Cellulosimicrobium funkei]|uniref:head maturation protease, ClpP-related n=1 Tax=Cellulosimicrobium funkei TaxID=264251 RepID=UPI0036D17972
MSSAKRANRYWGEQPLPKAKAEFFNAITTPSPSGDGSVATIRMYGPIDSWGGFWGISTKDVGQVLDALPDSVEQIILRVNSPGGEVFEGVSILNMLRAHKATVTAVVDGLAASAASVIATGCDETVMSPGTQMMIHSPSSIVWGNASEMRKTADVLDGIEASIIEVYTDKAGEKDWTTLLADETWMTAKESVDLGLADRVAVIPDAGETETVGEDEVVVTIPDDDVKDSAAARVLRIAASVTAAANKPPVSSEPGEPNQKEVAVSDNLKAGLRERLGVTDANATDEDILAKLDDTLETLTEPKAAEVATLPESAIVVDKAVHEQLVADAAKGRKAMETIDAQRRDDIVTAALSEGRIAPASRETWRAQLDKDEDGTKALLESMPKNTVPVAEIGHADDTKSTDDRLAAKAGWTATEEA